MFIGCLYQRGFAFTDCESLSRTHAHASTHAYTNHDSLTHSQPIQTHTQTHTHSLELGRSVATKKTHFLLQSSLQSPKPGSPQGVTGHHVRTPCVNVCTCANTGTPRTRHITQARTHACTRTHKRIPTPPTRTHKYTKYTAYNTTQAVNKKN